MYYLDVIPFRRMPWGLKEFTYSSAVDLAVGTLVQVRFAGQKIHGLVWRSRRSTPPNIKVQPIIKVVKEGWFTKLQQDFFEWVNQHYVVPLPTILYLFGVVPVQRGLPALPKTLKKNKGHPLANWRKYKQLVVESPPDTSSKIIADLYKSWVTIGQLLVLCPTIKQVQDLQQQLLEKHGVKAEIFCGQLNRTHLTTVWQQVLTDDQLIIIGTTGAAFLPFIKLQGVILWPEADQAAKAIESKPLTHLRSLAIQLSKIYQTRLGLIDHTPSLEAAWQAKHNHWPIVRLAAIPLRRNLQLSSPPLLRSPVFLDNLQKIINERNKVLIIAPRLGEGGILQCQDCSLIFNCPYCQLAYRVISPQTLKCHHCHTTAVVPATCPACHSFNLKAKQLTVNYIAKELKQNLKINTMSLDAQSKELPKDNDLLVVATTVALYRLNLQDYDLRVIMGFDVFLQQPQFNSTFKTYYLLRQLLFYGPTIIETMSAQHEIFNHIDDWHKFATGELSLRQRFGLPPLKSIIKLSIDSIDAREIERQAQDACTRLQKIKGFKISKPLTVPGRSPQRRFRRVILVENSGNQTNLDQLTKLDYSQWTLDPDPIDFS